RGYRGGGVRIPAQVVPPMGLETGLWRGDDSHCRHGGRYGTVSPESAAGTDQYGVLVCGRPFHGVCPSLCRPARCPRRRGTRRTRIFLLFAAPVEASLSAVAWHALVALPGELGYHHGRVQPANS